MLNRVIFLTSLVLFVVACGGGGGGNNAAIGGGGTTPAAAQQGVFLDSAVEGLIYTTDTESGVTDSDGTFDFQPGETISFSVGDILLGSGTAAAVMTPLDIVPGASSETNPQVTNILRFIQTLDTDIDAANGVKIDDAITTAARGQSPNFNFDRSIEEFESAPDVTELVNTLARSLTGSDRSLVAAADAQAHMRATLDRLKGNPDAEEGNNEFGTLALTGIDIDSVGSIFTPDSATPPADPRNTGVLSGDIIWSEGAGITLVVSVLDNEVASVTFEFISASDNEQTFGYALSCSETPAACTGLSVDPNNRSATFAAVTLPADANSAATEALVFDGALTW